MQKLWIIPVLFLSFLLLVSACQPQPTQTAASLTGLLSELSGQVNAKQASEADFHAASNGDALSVDGQVQTGEDGRARVDLSSGTILRLAPASLFTLNSNEETEGGLATKLKLELGRIFIILNGGSVDVETPSGVASVRGSYMMVGIDPLTQDVIVTCLEGNCSAGGIEFTQGQKVVFQYDSTSGKYLPPRLEPMTEEDFELWLQYNPEARSILNQIAAARATPTRTPLATPTPTSQTTIITGSEPGCFSLLAPPDGALINASGLVTFTWEAQEGAVSYKIVFTSPGGAQNTLITTNTELSNFIDIFPLGGVYSWEVTALDSNGQPICTASAFAFSKPPSPGAQPPPEGNTITCSIENAQWTNPGASCYCQPGNSGNPSYCRITKPTATPYPITPSKTPTPFPSPTPTYYVPPQ